MNLLLVEDDEDSVDLVKIALSMAQLSIDMHVAYDGVEALDYLSSIEARDLGRLPDLILLDLNLPRKNGRQLLADLAASTRLRSVPTVLLTTTEWHDDLKKAYPALQSQCFSKPMRFQEYIEMLKKLYDRRSRNELQGVAGETAR